MPKRRAVLNGIASGGIVLLAGCSGGSQSGGSASVEETSSVSMTGAQFDPRNIHVDTGTEVTWTNDDSDEHTVTSASDNWSKDATVPAGEQTTHTFQESGVYEVYCRYHGSADLSGMSMKVGVGDASIDDPLGGGGGGGGGGYG